MSQELKNETPAEWLCVLSLHDIRQSRQHEYCTDPKTGRRAENCDRFCGECYTSGKSRFQDFRRPDGTVR